MLRVHVYTGSRRFRPVRFEAPGVASREGTHRGATVTFVSRGFGGRRQADVPPGRLPPGQYATDDFPVLSAGPTPLVPHEEWRFAVHGEVGHPQTWSWDEFRALPGEEFVADIHCVTKWSKFDTAWEGVSVDILLRNVEARAEYVMVHCYGGYTTNLPLQDVTDGKAWIAYAYGGEPLAAEHGGPARLVVPHLYFWKSAKWVRSLELRVTDGPGFWETYGYHNYGDPWLEQRYAGD